MGNTNSNINLKFPKSAKPDQDTRIGISRVCFVKTVQNDGAVVNAGVDAARGHE